MIDFPRCGRCRYIVRGVASLRCPECGGDLREVGITLGKHRSGSRSPVIVAAMFFWTIAVLIFGGILGTKVIPLLPRAVNYTMTQHMMDSTPPGTAVTVETKGRIWRGAPADSESMTELSFNTAGRPPIVVMIDWVAETWSAPKLDGQRVVSRGLPTAGAIESALIDAGQLAGPLPSKLIQNLQAQLLTKARPQMTIGQAGAGQYWSSSSSSPEETTAVTIRTSHHWWDFVPAGLGLILWIVGMWYIGAKFYR